jgi:uncharacterized protein YkwD
MTRPAFRLALVLVLGGALALLPACGPGALGQVGGGGTPPPGGGSGSGMSEGERAWAVAVFDLVNQERVNAGVAPLIWDEAATGVAYAHSVDMQVRNFFDHTNPSGQSPGDRLTQAGIAWTACGENIAMGYGSPASVMNAWMNSPGHRSNILHPMFTHLGVGVHAPGSGPWWTQNFVRY